MVAGGNAYTIHHAMSVPQHPVLPDLSVLEHASRSFSCCPDALKHKFLLEILKRKNIYPNIFDISGDLQLSDSRIQDIHWQWNNKVTSLLKAIFVL
jgi:hypothetical protein